MSTVGHIEVDWTTEDNKVAHGELISALRGYIETCYLKQGSDLIHGADSMRNTFCWYRLKEPWNGKDLSPSVVAVPANGAWSSPEGGF